MANISLDDIISVQVTASAKQNVRAGYNVGLIVGKSARIPQSKRIVEFPSTDAMLEYGFQATDAEYLAALKYFGQSSVPVKVCVAIMCPSSVSQTLAASATGTGVTGDPTVNETTFKTAVGDKNGTYSFIYTTQWTLNGKAVTMADYGITYSGTAVNGDRIDVVYASAAVAETWVDALRDCKDKSNEWYGVYCACPIALGVPTRLTDAEHQEIVSYVETLKAMYFFDDNSDDDKGSGTGDIFSTMMTAGYTRYCGIYSNTVYAGAAVMGYAMGANTGETNSAYTMAYKRLNGVEVDDLSATEINNLNAKMANYYILRAGTYAVFERGVAGSKGSYVDEIIGVDQLTIDLQRACMDVLTSVPKVPYTDAGVLQFIVACNAVCNDAVRQGFLTPGKWIGGNVLNVNNGDTFETGYVVQAEAAQEQSATEKAARRCPPLYICAILAGAIHSVVIKLDVE